MTTRICFGRQRVIRWNVMLLSLANCCARTTKWASLLMDRYALCR